MVKGVLNGAIAWCSMGSSGFLRNEGAERVFACSARMAEALAVLKASAWAKGIETMETCGEVSSRIAYS